MVILKSSSIKPCFSALVDVNFVKKMYTKKALVITSNKEI